MSVDDSYDRLANDIGTSFKKKVRPAELYSFRCGACGYKNVHDISELTCGCGNKLRGRLVFRKVGDTAIYDTRKDNSNNSSRRR
ncbi:MAG: hypothetical protein ABI347_09590 [Nitrososphaera sp.]|jgi:hypothetical protein